MRLFNVRQGFATNSSSNHSILILPQGSKAPTSDEDKNFGWNFFTASDLESKENYLAKIIELNLKTTGWNDSTIQNYLQGLFDTRDIKNIIETVNIDHQSIITLPRNWDNQDINLEFINDFKEFILKSNVVIAGGNDNTSKTHPLIDKSEFSPTENLPRETSTNHLVARKDLDHWVVFNRVNGTKIRFSFNDIKPPTKAATPELVDIKITDFCPYNCTFCYQDSTLKGQHSSLDNYKKIIQELKDKKVFEVALGGGETTLHPQFIDILKITKEAQIVPNFTTKNLNLLRQNNANEIIELCGGLAFSIESLQDFQKVKLSLLDFENKEKLNPPFTSEEYCDPKKPWDPTITFQIVMGTMSETEFEKTLIEINKLHLRTTLLGYKQNGRGSQYAPHDYSNWLNIVEKLQLKHNLKISIDTALAAEYRTELLNKGLDERTFHIEEGAFSAYVDAVKMTISPSSYIGLEQSQPFNDSWLDSWKTMTATPETKKTIKINKK